MSGAPLIVYIPGLKPKPEAALHSQQLFRCLREGIRRIDAETAREIEAMDGFHLVSWTYDFYGEHRDIGLDLEDIEALLQKNEASEADVIVATSLKRRFVIWLFHAADALPFLIPKIATEEVEVHLRDFNRYVRNNHGIAEAAREKLKSVIRATHESRRPVLLLAHSMGSVIAFDALWQLSREENSDARIALLVTTGSPLGQRIVQRHLLGAKSKGIARYPANIDQWINIAAIGELTAVDRTLKNDFARMIEFGLVPDIDDRETFNYYHMHGTLNVHVEYGYLVNEGLARVVRDWWRAKAGG